ncbi:Acg family FMN-binding oxidoreductase [Mycolicibacterium vaccae]|uniref:Acg family FMN-binding oxidoreductase n=1 Tax=Mycolicibacterium vaccae TaxID=1810 RepID=UPI003CFC0CFC
MDEQFPDAETLRTALALAGRAPSVHNSQPWRWRVGERTLHLYANPDLLLSRTDPDGRDLMLSCGAALNHCVVALAAMGWQAKIRRFPDPTDVDHLATLTLYPYPAGELDVALAAAIPRRRTDRRHFSPWPVPGRDIALMGVRAARAGVILRRIDDLDALRALVSAAAARHLADPEYLVELTTWSGRYASRAGVPAGSVPGGDGAGPIPLRSFAGGVLTQPAGARPAEDNAVVVALGTVADDRIARLRAGEAASVVMLTATAQGLACCPITEPLEVEETRATVRADVFGTDAHPQIMLRIGWAPVNADPLPATPRRELAEIVTGLDGVPAR